VKRFVFKAHRLLYHSTLGSRVIKKKRRLWTWVDSFPIWVVVSTGAALILSAHCAVTQGIPTAAVPRRARI